MEEKPDLNKLKNCAWYENCNKRIKMKIIIEIQFMEKFVQCGHTSLIIHPQHTHPHPHPPTHTHKVPECIHTLPLCICVCLFLLPSPPLSLFRKILERIASKMLLVFIVEKWDWVTLLLYLFVFSEQSSINMDYSYKIV